ncbi:phosphorus acquisition-controlling protein [Magnaporthiopsis poae ATCC 64411]|uniref:Phosphorus acquisition-controlling protein n=1 Tax=Magnaporthiopsis poae (strain ATCC 64411 / 73-15) TaxID=644358 RepID=A0A0C4DTE2_MAGP6|nr:phosphorus acquisition-controlling protein [Magnaporthiopsis poae ATCC 64411]
MSIMDSTAAWDSQEGQMHPGPDDDFQHYLDMNAIGGLGDALQFDFHDFSEFQNAANAPHMLQRSQARAEHLDTPMSGTDMPALVPARPELPLHHSAPLRPMAMTSGPAHAAINSMVSLPTAMVSLPPTSLAPPTPSEAISDIDAKIVFLQQQRIQQQQRQLEEQAAFFAAQRSRMVPPTPQSLDLQARSRFYPQPDHTPQQGMYERYQRMGGDQQDLSFTPLVSPAVTPLETQFPMDSQFTIPGAYFSPLASPSLHAQAEGSSVMFDHISRANNNDGSGSSNNNNSPGDMDLETPTPTPSNPIAPSEASKKPRKNAGHKARGKSVRQSPITKPQRKKMQTTPIINSQALSELAEALEHGQEESSYQLLPPPAPHGPSSSPTGATDSENGSVSPQALSEMPPPPLPKPRSTRQSPYIEPQSTAPRSAVASLQGKGKLSPATPASLMRLTSPNSSLAAASGPTESMSHDTIENFELPESVNFQQKPRGPPLVTQSPLASPSLEPSSAKASPFQPLPSPKFAKPGAPASATQSPLLTGQASNSAAGTPAATVARRTPQMGPRGNKKRGSVSSSHVSPALRPRISPNIKPLLPGGTSAEDAASKLLASKSNYQNILEGIHVPGVSYPTSLSTNLTSKRTSHKIAEQGRRNRINSALQEIATLLPASVPSTGGGDDGTGRGPDDWDGGDGDGGGKKNDKQGGAGGPNSKASTVEMAIEYIKLLKQEVADATRRAEEAERKLLVQEREKEKAETNKGKEAELDAPPEMKTGKQKTEADSSAGS